MALEEIKSLKKAKVNLREENSKQSDALRLKGIQVDRLVKELAKYSDTKIKVALTLQEKQMILNALNMSEYMAWVEDPKTKHVLRQIYRGLKEKISESIKE